MAKGRNTKKKSDERVFSLANDDARFRPTKAYKNMDFIDSPDARLIRILAEFMEPQVRFRHHRVSDTIVFFGSARILAPEQARESLRVLKGNKGSKRDLDEAERVVRMSRYYDEAVELSRLMTQWSKNLGKGKQHFIICSGGGPGIMEAANKGASLAKGESIGFNISLPHEPNANPYITKALNFEFHYFFIRKYWFAYMAKALIIFPGGFGTLDELCEILTLIQTQKIRKKLPIVIYGTDYWNNVLRFDEMVKWGTISASDLKLFKFCDTPEEAFHYLTGRLTKLYRL